MLRKKHGDSYFYSWSVCRYVKVGSFCSRRFDTRCSNDIVSVNVVRKARLYYYKLLTQICKIKIRSLTIWLLFAYSWFHVWKTLAVFISCMSSCLPDVEPCPSSLCEVINWWEVSGIDTVYLSSLLTALQHEFDNAHRKYNNCSSDRGIDTSPSLGRRSTYIIVSVPLVASSSPY